MKQFIKSVAKAIYDGEPSLTKCGPIPWDALTEGEREVHYQKAAALTGRVISSWLLVDLKPKG